MLRCKTSQNPPKSEVARISRKYKELSQKYVFALAPLFLQTNLISFQHDLCEQYLPGVEILVVKEADVVHFLLWLPGSILRGAT